MYVHLLMIYDNLPADFLNVLDPILHQILPLHLFQNARFLKLGDGEGKELPQFFNPPVVGLLQLLKEFCGIELLRYLISLHIKIVTN